MMMMMVMLGDENADGDIDDEIERDDDDAMMANTLTMPMHKR